MKNISLFNILHTLRNLITTDAQKTLKDFKTNLEATTMRTTLSIQLRDSSFCYSFHFMCLQSPLGLMETPSPSVSIDELAVDLTTSLSLPSHLEFKWMYQCELQGPKYDILVTVFWFCSLLNICQSLNGMRVKQMESPLSTSKSSFRCLSGF